jgi:hypothetical protein
MTTIANSREAAEQLHQQAVDELKELASEGCEGKTFLDLDLSINSGVKC